MIVARDISPVTRMLISPNAIMRSFKKKGEYPMLFVVDRVGRGVMVLIVDILYRGEGAG